MRSGASSRRPERYSNSCDLYPSTSNLMDSASSSLTAQLVKSERDLSLRRDLPDREKRRAPGGFVSYPEIKRLGSPFLADIWLETSALLDPLPAY